MLSCFPSLVIKTKNTCQESKQNQDRRNILAIPWVITHSHLLLTTLLKILLSCSSLRQEFKASSSFLLNKHTNHRYHHLEWPLYDTRGNFSRDRRLKAGPVEKPISTPRSGSSSETYGSSSNATTHTIATCSSRAAMTVACSDAYLHEKVNELTSFSEVPQRLQDLHSMHCH